MAIWNLGSINADIVYSVPHILAPGETLSSTGRAIYLGGKGANMSVAAARAGAQVHHIGAVGADGIWARDRLLEYGVDTRYIETIGDLTSQAIIAVADDGENTIIIQPGASTLIRLESVQAALSEAHTGDRVVFQNETNLQVETAALAKQMGLKVAYAAAPFSAKAVSDVIEFIDFLILNEVEARQLTEALGKTPQELGVRDVIITLGSRGAEWFETDRGIHKTFEAYKVEPVDTTGAGDTFTGYVLAGLDRGQPMEQALRTANRAGAIMVTRKGAADSIPDLHEVQTIRL